MHRSAAMVGPRQGGACRCCASPADRSASARAQAPKPVGARCKLPRDRLDGLAAKAEALGAEPQRLLLQVEKNIEDMDKAATDEASSGHPSSTGPQSSINDLIAGSCQYKSCFWKFGTASRI